MVQRREVLGQVLNTYESLHGALHIVPVTFLAEK